MEKAAASRGLDQYLPRDIAAKRQRGRLSLPSAAVSNSSSHDANPAPQHRPPPLPAQSPSPAATAGSTGNPNSVRDKLPESDQSDADAQLIRPTAPSTHPSQVGHLTTSSPLVQAVYYPESQPADSQISSASRPKRSSTLSSTLSRESTDSLGSSKSSKQARRIASGSRLRDVFRSKRSSQKGASDGASQKSIESEESTPLTRPSTSLSQQVPNPDPESDRSPAVQRTSTPPCSDRSQRLSSLAPLKPSPPVPASAEITAPLIVNTPPTPTDPQPSNTSIPGRLADASPPGTMISQRRGRASSAGGAGPSRLSAVSPLSPTPENGPVSPANPATTFFSTMFSAVQNTANTLSTTIQNSTLTQGPGKTKAPGSVASATSSKEQSERAEDGVQVESSSIPDQPAESKEPAVKTLGMGDLSLSQLGIVDAASGSHSPVASRFAESESRPRSESAPADAQGADAPEDALTSRPRSLHESIGGDRTPPGGSVYEGKSGGVHRSGSIRSALGHRRNRGSSVATHGTTGTTTTIGHALMSVNSSVADPLGRGIAPRLTGFAVATKKRNRDFHALFKSVPDDDYLIEDYSCALQREILAHGRLYISEGHLCFSSNILGWVTTLVISFDEIVSVEKRSTALVFKNGLEIATLHAKHIFASFASRDTTYDLIIKIWKLGHPHLQSSLNGVRLEEPGGDRTEKIETASVSAVGSHSISGSDGSDSDDEEDDDVYDEDEDEQDAQDANQPAEMPAPEPAEKPMPRKASGVVMPPADKPDESAPTGAADFPGPATHPPTDCGDAATHYERIMGDEVIPAPLGKIYSLLFGPDSAAWMGKWLTENQKCTELQLEDKRGLSEEVKSRNLTYIKPLNAAIGPKQTKCIVTEQIETINLEKAVTVVVNTQNPDVPSGNIFTVKTKYCLTWAENNQTRVQINCTIEWTGKSWLKGAIERGANDGQQQYCRDLFASLKAAVSSRSRPAAASNGAAPRGKKRGRKSKLAEASNPASDAESLTKPSAKQSWGVFEPVRPFLGPVADAISPILTGNVVYGLLVGLLVATWFGFGTRPNLSPYGRELGYHGANYPQRLAAYEEMWRREESDLWEWIEERVGLERLGRGDPVPRRVDFRGVEERVRGEGMDEREVREAIRVTEEHLRVLKSVVERESGQEPR